MSRLIGIRHRVKRTADNEARPTQVTISENVNLKTFDLDDETAELNFLRGQFPVEWREPDDGEDLSVFKRNHCKWRKLKKTEKAEDFPEERIRLVEGKPEYLTKVPCAFNGLQTGDTVLMILGGSGDYLAYALSRRADAIKAKVKRVPPFDMKQFRGDKKDDDSINLIKLYEKAPDLFQDVTPRSRDMIKLRILYTSWQEAMKQRIASEQRLYQWLIGKTFTEADLNPDDAAKKPFNKKGISEQVLDLLADGDVDAAYLLTKKNDPVVQNLIKEETARAKEMENHLETLDIYTEVLSKVEGCGPKIAARLIVAIRDISRFQDTTRPDGGISSGMAKLKSYCGCAPDASGKFRRRRSGELANWSNEARLGAFLIAAQFNRKPESEWGKKLLEHKARLRETHPDVVCKDCSLGGKTVRWEDCPTPKKHKRAYNDGHILKMALWRTSTKFVEWLWKEWTRLESERTGKQTVRLTRKPAQPGAGTEARPEL